MKTLSSAVTMKNGILVWEVSRRSQDVLGRGGKAKLHLPVLMINMDESSNLAQAAQMRDISFHDKCRGMTQSNKSNKHFHIYNYPHRCFSSKSYKRRDFHLTWKGKEGSKHLRVGDGNKVIIISFCFFFYFGAPHPPASPCLLLALSIWLLHFRMGVHGWVNGLVSCKVTAQKTRSFLPG